jgi:DNA (cytosine-5)-methyltransferase 1
VIILKTLHTDIELAGVLKKMRIVDLFAGCGGLSLGFMQTGYTVVKAVEFDPIIANTYIKNHPEVDVIVDDIKNIDNSGLLKYGEVDIIIGGPPCQGFSMAGARIRRGFIDDPRNYLFKHYFNVVKTARPKVFIMENVKGIATMRGGEIFEEIKGTFQDAEVLGGKPYSLYCRVVRAVEFGVPQKRERMIIVGTTIECVNFEQLWEETRAELAREVPTYFDPVTVADAIGNMPPATADGVIENPKPETRYQKYLASESGRIENHTQSNHSSVAVDRIRRVVNGENFTSLEEKINSVHSGAYGRLCWDEPAATITTRFDTPAGGRFIHPAEDRTLTPREAARIQSFPDDFVFYGDRRSISRQIGNAVPPKISFFLARLVKNILAEEK